MKPTSARADISVCIGVETTRKNSKPISKYRDVTMQPTLGEAKIACLSRPLKYACYQP